MAEPATLLYLEPDDEITSVVRRLRESDAGRVVLVASGRSKATTSAVALRLLAGVAAEEGREVALVADAAGRALAAEAGIPAFASVAEANADDAVPAEPPPARRAQIRVVRGDEARAVPVAPGVGPGDETMAVPVAASAPAPPRTRAARPPRSTRRGFSRAAVGVLVALLLLAVGALAAVAPAASIVVVPNRLPIEPVTYTISLPVDELDEGQVEAETEGTATGVFSDPTPAVGEVTFSNYNTSPVRVDAGTQVAAGEVVFATAETIVVPTGFFTIPGSARVGVTAIEPGPSGNLPADAIDTVLDEAVRDALRAFSDNPNRIVRNEQPTGGGEENEEPEVTREDVTRARRAIRDDLSGQLAGELEDDPQLVYGPIEADDPRIPIPGNLIGRRGEEMFSLSGTQAYRRASIRLADVVTAATERLLGDESVIPAGRQVVADTIAVEVLGVTAAGEELEVEVTVSAEGDPTLDEAEIRDRVVGLGEAEAEAALAPLGEVDVELWPGWVDSVPQLAWRIELRIEDGPSPSGSASP